MKSAKEKMSKISINLKTLRQYKGVSQQQLADALSIKRSTLSAWENGMSEPNIGMIVRIADHFRVSIDRLLRQDLRELTRFELKRIEEGFDVDLRGRHLRILATTVDKENEEQVELVPEKAKAGYTAGYSDPEFIEKLPRMSLPFLDRNKKYRSFPVQGDSMPPVDDGDYVVAEYVEDWRGLKDGESYVLVTATEGIVFKTVYNHIVDKGTLLLVSKNPAYRPYEIHIRDVMEIWQFRYYISSDLTEVAPENHQISTALREIQMLLSRKS